MNYDARFGVGVGGDASAINRVVLVRPGAVTHANNMTQQVIQLPLAAHTGGLVATSPLDATVAPPGGYMLFAQNADGAMSVATWVRIDPAAPAASLWHRACRDAHPAPPPAVVPRDETAPTTTVSSTTARVRGRAVTVRLKLRSNERASVRVSVAGVGRGSKVTLKRRWRSATALTAARTRSLVIAAHLGGLIAPKRLRVTLRVTDPAGNVRRVVRVVALVRT